MNESTTNQIHQTFSGKIDLIIQKQLCPNANRKLCTLCLYNDNWVYHKESSLQHKKKYKKGIQIILHVPPFNCQTKISGSG
jgi:hypothetical protein